MRPPCSVDGCEVGASLDGLCSSHRPETQLRRPLPMGPLVAAVEGRGGPRECGAEYNTALHRRYFRAKLRGYVGPVAADRLAHDMLGCHPCEVWPEWFGVTA